MLFLLLPFSFSQMNDLVILQTTQGLLKYVLEAAGSHQEVSTRLWEERKLQKTKFNRFQGENARYFSFL